MIGFVVGRSAVETVAGVTPLSIWAVRRIKLTESLKANGSMYALLAFPLLVLCVFAAVLVASGRVASAGFLAIPGVIFGVHALLELRTSTLVSRWRVSSTGFAGNRLHFHGWMGVTPLPLRAAKIANRVRALGLDPEVEWLDDDPFLFVTIKGTRVYLYHWV